MNIWIAGKTSLSNKEPFYIELNLEHITDKDYVHSQKKNGKYLK